jgi:ornithine--oxo-acid transaminase
MDARFPAGEAPALGFPALPVSIARERKYAARNYDPLPVVLAHGDGCWLWDEHGRRYLDMMSAYSAVSHGHAHPRIVRALVEQAQRLAVTSRVFHNELLPRLFERLTALTGLDRVLPASGGAESVETALKAVRKWGYKVKGIPHDRAEVIVCKGNFHGRSITIVGFSSEAQYRDGFGPFPAGFRHIPYGDADALARAIGPNTAAFLVEPIQGEGGIVVPPAGYLAECARICRERNVLLVCDEIQTGMGRTGKFLACQHDGVRPDAVILGKALGGGLLPVSAVVGTENLMQVFTPGDHGSTFGGNPLAAAVAIEALEVLFDEHLIERSAEMGAYLLAQLRTIRSPLIRDVRGRGLFVGVEVDRERATARDVVDRLLARGILSKDTHGTVVRFAPPLVIDRESLGWAIEEVRAVFAELGDGLKRANAVAATGRSLGATIRNGGAQAAA